MSERTIIDKDGHEVRLLADDVTYEPDSDEPYKGGRYAQVIAVITVPPKESSLD